jgi:hypothetical protein
MKLILSGANKAQEHILEATRVSRVALAKYWEWDLIDVKDNDYTKEYHPSWQKIDLIQSYLKDYEAVLWLDADSFVTNPAACPPPRSTAFTISEDWCAPDTSDKVFISCGNFWTRNKPEAYQFFEKMDKYKRMYAFRKFCCWEQDAFHKVVRETPLKNEVTILERTAMNAAMCSKKEISTRAKYERGDFLCHLTGVDDRMAYINQLTEDLKSFVNL